MIADESSHLYDAMHGLIPRLTPLVLDHFGLEEALGDLVERTRRSQPGVRIDMHVDLHVDLPGGSLPPEVLLTLYRAAQEGITNALRHGQAGAVVLQVHADEERLTLEVMDDGSGLAPDWAQRGGHYGLRWLAERVESVGGRFRIEAHATRGVRLQVQVPWPLPSRSASEMA